MPMDGTFPTATAQWEKRNIALEIPVWDEELCIQCGKCVLVCPHAVIRAKVYPSGQMAAAPESFKSAEPKWKSFAASYKYSLQVAPEDLFYLVLFVTFNFMILECSGRHEWRVLAAKVGALKTLGMSRLMLKSKLVRIESNRGSRARGQTAGVCRGTKLSFEELELLWRHSREILDKEERFDVCLVGHQKVA